MPSPSTVLLRTQSDERLVALVRAGHERAFDAIVERYRKPLLRVCVRILPEARSEDALQQALLAAWKGLERGDEVQELRPWLYRIARNTALNQLRMAGYDLEELVETLSAANDPEEEVVRRAVVRQTLAAVAALPDRQREALLRTAVEGRGQDEVARDLGLSDTAVRALVHRARVRVRSAATALVPLPLASWVASVGGTDAAVTLAKAGTLAVLAGGAVTAAPTLIYEHGGSRPSAVHAHYAARPPARRAPRATAVEPVATTVGVSQPPAGGREATVPPARHEHAAGRGGHVGSNGGGAEHGGWDDTRSDAGDDGHRSGGETDNPVTRDGSGSDDHASSGPGDSGSVSEDDGEGTSQPLPAPTPVATPTEHRSSGGGENTEPSAGHDD
jgi:RNA polymerase sigma factor (sigma-70 family)